MTALQLHIVLLVENVQQVRDHTPLETVLWLQMGCSYKTGNIVRIIYINYAYMMGNVVSENVKIYQK